MDSALAAAIATLSGAVSMVLLAVAQWIQARARREAAAAKDAEHDAEDDDA